MSVVSSHQRLNSGCYTCNFIGNFKNKMAQCMSGHAQYRVSQSPIITWTYARGFRRLVLITMFYVYLIFRYFCTNYSKLILQASVTPELTELSSPYSLPSKFISRTHGQRGSVVLEPILNKQQMHLFIFMFEIFTKVHFRIWATTSF